MLNLFFVAFVMAFLGAGVRKPFLFVLAYSYIDIVAPQKVSWGFLQSIPISLIAFVCAFGGWMLTEDKRGTRFALRQFLLLALLVYCGLTTRTADFPIEAANKWTWVWKALVFAMFLPLTLRTRLRIEAMALVMTLSVGVIVIGGGIKTIASGGGGYGELKLLVNDNTGLYEGSIISAVAIALVPLIFWLIGHGTIFPKDWRVKLFGWALAFSCLLMPVGTQARTGLICVAVLAILLLRSVKNRFAYIALMGVGSLLALTMAPKSFTDRMGTIENHQGDQSASTRIAVWKWTIEYAKSHPFGGGFDAFRQNHLTYETTTAEGTANNAAIEGKAIEEHARAYHSSYFEMLGEQGYPGLALWLLLHFLGIWQMEVIRRRYRKDPPENFGWVSPLANALQQSQIVYLVGSLFVGIAFQPFCYMLVGLQCGLWSYLRRVQEAHRPPFFVRRQRRSAALQAAAEPA
ncbi:putative O-glycosylation ligase, exosortase A system-associated [Novosphingobium lentum]|uniref:putative O-glycosylation ligase, exosortase A system-associated n=1 Tax=Novosphingobium lentum TaxID=145287 RepID=UPI000835815B|nr:putative O-glycosylation ligase, exosortase A system-associated [Novosphingobium lentum]